MTTTTEENNNKKLNFPQFDVVSDFSDHHFLSSRSKNPSKPLKPNEASFKAISKEWRILRENLPESIFVRVSETRFDLLRAAIIGAAATPYHDGVFIFDISLPPNYPKYPPKFHYHSHGHRLNPNLYSNGTVCLSLLNTWTGVHHCELWNSKQSTILQALLSIQSLVLNEKPYYNEPGRLWFKHEKSSEYYSQDSFVLTCKSAIALIRNPPRNFEPLIRNHFRERASGILAACEAYANGRVLVGFYGCGGVNLPGFEIRSEFQKDVKVVYGILVLEFLRLKATLPPAAGELVLIENPPVVVKKTKKKVGVLRRIIDKILDFLEVKKKE